MAHKRKAGLTLLVMVFVLLGLMASASAMTVQGGVEGTDYLWEGEWADRVLHILTDTPLTLSNTEHKQRLSIDHDANITFKDYRVTVPTYSLGGFGRSLLTIQDGCTLNLTLVGTNELRASNDDCADPAQPTIALGQNAVLRIVDNGDDQPDSLYACGTCHCDAVPSNVVEGGKLVVEGGNVTLEGRDRFSTQTGRYQKGKPFVGELCTISGGSLNCILSNGSAEFIDTDIVYNGGKLRSDNLVADNDTLSRVNVGSKRSITLDTAARPLTFAANDALRVGVNAALVVNSPLTINDPAWVKNEGTFIVSACANDPRCLVIGNRVQSPAHVFDGNGTCGVCGLQAVLSVGDVYFTIHDFTPSAIEKAIETGKPVVLIADANTNGNDTITGGEITLELNGHTLKCPPQLSNNDTLSVADGKLTVQNGTLSKLKISGATGIAEIRNVDIERLYMENGSAVIHDGAFAAIERYWRFTTPYYALVADGSKIYDSTGKVIPEGDGRLNASRLENVTIAPNVAAAITAQPQDASYQVFVPASALSVTAQAPEGGMLTYQWYMSTTNATAGGTAIAGAIQSSYTPSTAAGGTTYYYCVVTSTVANERYGTLVADTVSNAAAVTCTHVNATVTPAAVTYDKYSTTGVTFTLDCGTHTFSRLRCGRTTLYLDEDYTVDGNRYTILQSFLDPYPAGYDLTVTFVMSGAPYPTATIAITDTTPAQTPTVVGPSGITCSVDEAVTLRVLATVTDGGVLTYQWYAGQTQSTANGTPIDGATENTYAPSTAQAGTTYYYCVVTNTNEQAMGEKVVSVASTAAAVTVVAPAPEPTATPEPTLPPKTGDGAAPLLWLLLLLLGGTGALALMRKRKA